MTVKHGLFSIVIPHDNIAGFLPETIESVLANLQPEDRYFIVDGGSTDGSVEIIREYERWSRTARDQEGIGDVRSYVGNVGR